MRTHQAAHRRGLLSCTDYAQKNCSANPACNRPQRHESEKYEHSTVAFEVADVENFGVSEAKANTKHRTQHGSKNESYNCEKTTLHRINPLALSDVRLGYCYLQSKNNAPVMQTCSGG